PDNGEDRPEPKTEIASEPAAISTPRIEPRPSAAAAAAGQPRSDFRPPAGYMPIILPGESISKYRNLPQQPASQPQEERLSEAAKISSTPVEDFAPLDVVSPEPHQLQHEARGEFAPLAEMAAVMVHEEDEPAEAAGRDEKRDEPESLNVAPVEPSDADLEAPAPESPEATMIAALAAAPQNQEEIAVADAGPEVAVHASEFPQHSAPLEAPEGRTLEHEVLEDEEIEFHPVPDDISALSEVAGDEELVLEEETLDSDNGYSERWIPKIADVDEDEVVAAEMRGEHIYEGVTEEENGEEAAEEEPNGRAELRASSPTAGYQQRQAERPGYERRYRDRGRRGGPRRGVRARPNTYRNQPLITDLLKEGQEVLIQIAKEPIGKKGARITSHIALPGRFLVYMPTVNHVGVSRKIASEEERQRLKRIVTSERENGLGGFIVRTAAANI